jgi:hypothetical protein
MWHHIHKTKFNYFTIVVMQLADVNVYKIYARRMGLGIWSKVFILSSKNRQVVMGDWMLGVQELSAYLDQFPVPLTVKTSTDTFWDKFKKVDDTTYYH